MAVTYSPEQKKTAADRGWRLATLAVPGVEFQGPVSPSDAKELEAYILTYIARRAKALKADLAG
jgi:hypothetical protein